MEPKENKTRKTWVTPEIIIIAYNDIESGIHHTNHEGTLVPTGGGNVKSNGGGLFPASFVAFVHS